MAHSRTARKNVRQNRKRRLHNRTRTATMRSQIKRVLTTAEQGDAATTEAEFSKAQKLIDKAAKNNRIHANKAARMKSQLARAAAAASKGE